MRAQAGAEVSDHQCEPDNTEERSPGAGSSVDIGGIGIGKGLRGRPDKLRDIDFHGRENADHQAGQHSGEQDVAARILRLFREGGDAIKAYVSKYSDGGATKESAEGKGLRVVERAGEKAGIAVGMSEDVAEGSDEDHNDDCTHANGQSSV